MHKLVFINPNHRKFSGKVIDGGFSRNCAWESWLLKEKGNLIDVKLKKGKVIHLFQIFVNLLLRKNDTVFFLYPRVGAPLYQKDGVSKVCTKAFFKGIDLANKKNRVVFDIADLKYEQAIDLELANEDVLPRLHEIEERLFSTKSYFIFASYQMREYVCRKYNVDYAKTDVCINGGHLLKDNLSSMSVNTNIVNYVYAGTLNKGRQIEQLISSFPDDEKIHLYLLGTNGEWINSKSKNITYLGARIRNLGIPFNMYQLRHTVSTNLITNNIDQRTIIEILGHEKIDMSIYYARSNEELKRNALNIID